MSETNLKRVLDGISGIHNRIARNAGLSRCRMKCEVCGREQTVSGGHCLANGWPECHGYTMTLQPRAGGEKP